MAQIVVGRRGDRIGTSPDSLREVRNIDKPAG
jgi:hypothetical protein